MASTETKAAETVTMPDDVQARLALDIDGAKVGLNATRTIFSSGSHGFRVVGKVDGQDGRRYQVNANLVLIGSKPKA
jgi:hypothetical protein